MSKRNQYNEALSILQELHKCYPTYNMGRHLATALDEYGDIWGLTDKELVYALSKYKGELDADFPHVEDSDIDMILKDGMDLDNILNEEEEDNGDY